MNIIESFTNKVPYWAIFNLYFVLILLSVTVLMQSENLSFAYIRIVTHDCVTYWIDEHLHSIVIQGSCTDSVVINSTWTVHTVRRWSYPPSGLLSQSPFCDMYCLTTGRMCFITECTYTDKNVREIVTNFYGKVYLWSIIPYR